MFIVVSVDVKDPRSVPLSTYKTLSAAVGAANFLNQEGFTAHVDIVAQEANSDGVKFLADQLNTKKMGPP